MLKTIVFPASGGRKPPETPFTQGAYAPPSPGDALRAAAAWIVALVASTVLAAPARADLDPELDKPYQVKVVLDVARHRLLTEVFRQQVQRELRDGLRTAFGDLARVDVVDTHPLLAEVRKHGLGPVLDRWLDLTGIKTHFVLIDYVAGQYQIQTRQHDGLTGQASPVVRRDRTADRQFVARLAALLIDRDFGLVGTVGAGASANNALVTIKGAALGVKLDRWVKKGDVFMLVPVRPPAPAPRMVLGEASLLQVEGGPDNGVVRCRLLERFAGSLSRSGAAGYRCLKLNTVKAPLRVRLLQRGTATPTPAPSLRVEVRRNSFDKMEEPTLQGVSNNVNGSFPARPVKNNVFENVAFVTVETEPRAAQVPVPLIDDNPVTVRVAMGKSDGRSDLLTKKNLWDDAARESGLVLRVLFKELQELGAKANLRDRALKRAQQGLSASRESLTRLSGERRDLLKEAQEGGLRLDTTFGDQWLASLEKGHKELESYIATQEKILKEENDPKRQEWLALVRDGKLEEGRAEFDKALAKYNLAIKKGCDDAGLKAHRADLAKRWKTQGAEHAKARAFIYGEWPAADLVKERTALKEAADALEECRKAGDTLGPQKLLQAAIAHGGKLQEQKAALQLDKNEEDRKAAEVIADVSKELAKLIGATQAYLKQAAKSKDEG